MVNLSPKWISTVFKGAGERLNKTWTGLFFIIKNNDLPAVMKQVVKNIKVFPGERFCLDTKKCTLLFTLTIQGMLRIDKVRARTLFSSLILLQKTHFCRKFGLLQSCWSVLMCSVHDSGQSALVCVHNPASQPTY